MTRTRLVTLTACALALFSTLAFGSAQGIAPPPDAAVPNSSVVFNPGKGWVLYGKAADFQGSAMLDVASVGYKNFRWAAVQGTQGTDPTLEIETFVSDWAALGKKAAFGIRTMHVPCNAGQPDEVVATPPWVFDAAGVDPVNLVGCRTPRWSDPDYETQYKALLAKVAAKYDGDPRVAYIDVRSYGNWGEQHMYWPGRGSCADVQADLLSPDQLKAHLQLYLDAFSETPIVTPYGADNCNIDNNGTVTDGAKDTFNPVYDWAVQNGIGVRRDGVMACVSAAAHRTDVAEPHECWGSVRGEEVTRTLGTETGVLEFISDYTDAITNSGPSDEVYLGSAFDTVLQETIRTSKTDYMALGAGGEWRFDPQKRFMDERPALIKSMQRLMGYEIQMPTAATVPASITKGISTAVTVPLQNTGVDFLELPVRPVLALLSGATVKEVYVPETEGNVMSLVPGASLTNAQYSLVFDQAANAKYSVGLGLFTTDALARFNKSDPDGLTGTWKPDIAFGTSGTNADGWLPLRANVQLNTGSLNVPTKIVHEAEYLDPCADDTSTPTKCTGFSPGKHHTLVRRGDLWNGMGDRFNATDVGHWIKYPFTAPAQRDYSLRLRLGTSTAGGQFKVTVGGQPEGIVTHDTYAATPGTKVVDLGLYPLAAGQHSLKLTVSAKGSAGGAQVLSDQLVLRRNWLTNGSFEDELTTGWTRTGTGWREPAGGTSGSARFKTGSDTAPTTVTMAQTTPALGAGSYTARLRYKGIGTFKAATVLRIKDASSGATLKTVQLPANANAWALAESSSFTVAAGKKVVVEIVVDGLTGSWFSADAIELTQD